MAAPLATVTAYSNSGFNMNNIPATAAILEANSTANQLEVINCLPVSGQTTTSITVKPFANLSKIDYIKIVGSDSVPWYGIVTGYRYVSMTSVVITAQLDGWLTCQAMGINKITGYIKRHSTADDTFAQYCEDDPFIVPSKPLELIASNPLFNETSYKSLVESTIDLVEMGGDTYNLSRTFDSDGEVVVPLATASEATQIKLSGFMNETATQTIEGRGIYDADNAKVKKGIAVARSLGYENGILGSYMLPNRGGSGTPTDGFYSVLNGGKSSVTVGAQFTFIYDSTVQNKRLLYGKTSQYILWSPASGQQLKVNPEDIYEAGSGVTINYMADPRSKGKPYFGFGTGATSVHGGLNKCITGAQWDNLPLNYQNSSGLGKEIQLYNAQLEYAVQDFNEGQTPEVMGNLLGNAGGFVGNAMELNIGGAVQNFGDYMSRMTASENAVDAFGRARSLEKARFLATKFSAPQIVSPPDGEFIRDVYGNGCILARYKLSTYDLRRLDKVLNMFGYKDTKVLEMSDLSVGVYCTYIEASDVTINSNAPHFAEQIAVEQFRAGVRLWKQRPDSALYANSNR